MAQPIHTRPDPAANADRYGPARPDSVRTREVLLEQLDPP